MVRIRFPPWESLVPAVSGNEHQPIARAVCGPIGGFEKREFERDSARKQVAAQTGSRRR